MTPPRFFSTPDKFGAWLEKNHEREMELWVGFYKKDSGRPSMTWPESVDEALRFGWIDAVRKTIDDESYMIRFTRRKPTSIWSKVNIAKVEALIAANRMAPAGIAAYALRTPERSGVYSFEREPANFDAEQLRAFHKNKKAWEFFERQPPGYRRVVTHYVTSAKRAETRDRRLAAVIEHSARSERIPQYTLAPKSK
ncbi:MAG: YdeI/OmpD-associated family protein [bacterium]